MPATDVIVIGASAGGVDVLRQLVSDLPHDLPAAVFVVLHIGPHPSFLPDILRRAGPLSADHAIDGAPIENGRIYVGPPDHHLILSEGHMHVTRGPRENNARPSINTLFRTGAIAHGRRVAGVILTGNLNDGTVGLWEIKRHGGITVVQDPEEATSPSMPMSALENVQIDYRVSVHQMGSLLGLLASGKLETEMETRAEIGINQHPYSGVTCPECRGPLQREEHGPIKEFKCRVGHVYTFDSMLEQHAVTTERALWTAILAVEEAVILAREAGERAADEDARHKCEQEARTKERQAAVMRTLLTQPDALFASASNG